MSDMRTEIKHLTRPVWRMLWVIVSLIVVSSITMRAVYLSQHQEARNAAPRG